MANWQPNIGTFSKAIDGSVSCNFSESGGVQCSDLCPMKKGGCYAIACEKLKPSIHVSGERKRKAGFAACAMRYAKQLTAKATDSVPWVRISSFGSVPGRLDFEGVQAAHKLFAAAVRAASARRVHFPVESIRKFKLWSPIAAAYGITVRVSAHNVRNAAKYMRDGIPASLVMLRRDGETRADLLKRSREFAAARRGAIVCPAIADTFNRKPDPAKCGKCTACGNAAVKLIIYPEH